ncbi:MAG: hypothetical protein JW836_00835 [Deltaproteobacteria bacterium]|nr:hypothetical protein [Deltaproteobacteria bacterium]
MESTKEYFLCDVCQNKDFTLIHNFSMRFYTVNFSDELVYERLTEECYQCTSCKKIFTKETISNSLGEFKKKRKIRE